MTLALQSCVLLFFIIIFTVKAAELKHHQEYFSVSQQTEIADVTERLTSKFN